MKKGTHTFFRDLPGDVRHRAKKVCVPFFRNLLP